MEGNTKRGRGRLKEEWTPEVFEKRRISHNAANYKYRAKALKRIPLDVPVEFYNELKTYCDAHNTGVNTFIRKVLREAMDADPINKEE